LHERPKNELIDIRGIVPPRFSNESIVRKKEKKMDVP